MNGTVVTNVLNGMPGYNSFKQRIIEEIEEHQKEESIVQPPKFTNFKDKAGESRWHVEDANGVLTGSSNQAFRDRTDCDRAIHDHIENVIAASGLSVSLGLSYQPIIEYVGYEEDQNPKPPPADGPIPEQTVDTPDQPEDDED